MNGVQILVKTVIIITMIVAAFVFISCFTIGFVGVLLNSASCEVTHHSASLMA